MEKHHFIEIINQNRGTIKSLCKVYYSSDEDQKDAFQDVVLQLWKSVDSFLGKSEVSTWIYRVSLNTLLAKKRGEKKSVCAEPIESHQEPCYTAGADDDLELLYLVIQSLKDVDKAIVVLYLEGYRNKEIADILKLSATNVATRFNRLKSELKVKFKNASYAAK